VKLIENRMPVVDIDTLNNVLYTNLVEGNWEACNQLIRKGANLNHTNPKRQTPLITFILRSDPNAVRYLLDKGVDVHMQDNDGKDACDYARMLPLFRDWPEFKSCPNERFITKKEPSPKL
jgi:ankyrin repeat protein